MTISAIVAMDKQNAIGKQNELPWRLPEDLKFFKRTTLGKPVLMGRKTFESLGKPLPGRLNIVISTQDLQLPEGVLLYHDIESGVKRLLAENTEEGFIIGGGKIFDETMHLLDRMYITHVDTVVDGADAFFPHVDHAQWNHTWEEKRHADEKHTFDYTFRTYERISL